MKRVIITGLMIFLFQLCNQHAQAQDYKKAADEHCQCFQPFADSISEVTKSTLIKATRGKSFKDSLMVEMSKLPPDDQSKLLAEMEQFAKAMDMAGEGEGLISCMGTLEEKYADIYKEEKNILQLVTVLQEKKCEFLAAIMILAIEGMKK
jgi:hypothetical protein